MLDLIKQEQFELSVLDFLNTKKILPGLVFIGGTMLRLCHGLDRYSTDLDFWLIDKEGSKRLFKDIRHCLEERFTLTDAAAKFHTLLFEVRSAEYPRHLKIEIRKQEIKTRLEQNIAFSKHSTVQVLVKTPSLADMMSAKVAALLDRREIRDAFDIEFLLKRGVSLADDRKILEGLLKNINSFSKNDYTVKLGSLLEPSIRKHYVSRNFTFLKMAIQEKLNAA